MSLKAIKGRVFYLIDDPYFVGDENSYRYLENGAIIIENGKIKDVGNADKLTSGFKGEIETYDENHIILPGFIDSHLHFPQTQMIASYGKQLLDWLNNYTFIAEQQFSSKKHADMIAKIFYQQLLKNGVTTAAAYCTVHPQSVDAYFEEAQRYGMRMIGGKVMMSRNAPDELIVPPEQSYKESEELIQKWHNKGRNHYAVTPRFAITCPQEELQYASELLQKHENLYMQTHLSENKDEIAFTLSLFPERKNYTEIYEHYGLLGERCILGHVIHTTEEELQVLSKTKTVIAHCPTSNGFLGSGLLDIERAKSKERPVYVGLASDVGAGTSFSPLQTLNEAYKVAQLQGQSLSSVRGFYLATLGNARALRLEDKIGSFARNSDADIVVLTNKSTPFMEFRQSYSKDILEELFVQMTLGDERSIKATYSYGNKVCEDGITKYIQ